MKLQKVKSYLCRNRNNADGYVKLPHVSGLVIKIISIPKKQLEKIKFKLTQPAVTCSKLTIETVEQGVKCVQS